MFLNHYLLIWLALLAGIVPADHLLAFALASLLLSAFSFHVVEAPVLKRRRAVRYKKVVSPRANAVEMAASGTI